jgi:hypothetical protein
LTNDGAALRSKAGLGYKAFCQFSAAARIEAANKGLKNVEIQRKPVGKSGEKFKLLIAFISQRKTHEEVTPAYSKKQITDICSAIITKQTTSKRRKASSSHMVNEEQIAHRSPPLFWSIFYEYMMVHDNDDKDKDHTGGAAAASMQEAIELLQADVAKAQAPIEVE